MKSTITFIISICLAQAISAQTTLEEYNYVTKGYKIQIESGLDMKKGYSFKDLVTVSTNFDVKRTIKFKGLYREGDSAPCAIMGIYQRQGYGPEFICVPHQLSDETIWDKFSKRISDFSSGTYALQTISLGLAKCTALFSENN